MVSLAKKFNISDRGLAKICAVNKIPTPSIGYWNKLWAGKKVNKPPLLSREAGMANYITIGQSDNHYSYNVSDEDVLNEPLLPAPQFEICIEEIRTQVAIKVNKAPFPKTLTRPHNSVNSLLKKDAERLKKIENIPYPESLYRILYNPPIFESAFEKRRLRIINSLFTCFSYCGMTPSIQDKYARNLTVNIGYMHISFMLDSMNLNLQQENERNEDKFTERNPNDKMILTLLNYRSSKNIIKSWQDNDKDQLEDHLRSIAIEIVVYGEEAYRESEYFSYQDQIYRKAKAQENLQKRKVELEHKAIQDKIELEKKCVNHLLYQANALHQANRIRAYVSAVQEANQKSTNQMSTEELATWTKWALDQANRIDPIFSGKHHLHIFELAASKNT